MTKVKICGLRSSENALQVARMGADMIGLNFYPESPRYIEPEAARELADRLRAELGDACPTIVGVFVNATAAEVRQTVVRVGLDYAQLHGDEPIETLRALAGIAYKALRPADDEAARASLAALKAELLNRDDAPSLLLDAFNPKLYGGVGETASETIALMVKAAAPKMMLAGGLNPGNVAERARRIRPWGVDVAGGVEAGRPGIKDLGKTSAFIKAARAADK